MTRSIIRAVENNEAFTIDFASLEQPIALPHNESFPSMSDVGYEEEIEFDEPEGWDKVQLVFDGCPDGYVILVFWRKGQPVLCMLYGPSGFVAHFGSIAEARNAARAVADSKPASSGYGSRI